MKGPRPSNLSRTVIYGLMIVQTGKVSSFRTKELGPASSRQKTSYGTCERGWGLCN